MLLGNLAAQHVGRQSTALKADDVKPLSLVGFFLALKMQQTLLTFSNSIKWQEVGWQRAINARLKDGHSNLSV